MWRGERVKVWAAIVALHLTIAAAALWVGWRAVPEALGHDSVTVTVVDPASGDTKKGTARPLRVNAPGHAGAGEVLALAWQVRSDSGEVNVLPSTLEVHEAWVAVHDWLGDAVDAERVWVAVRDVGDLAVGDVIVPGARRTLVYPDGGGDPRSMAGGVPPAVDSLAVYWRPVESPPPLPTWGWKGDSIGLAAALVWLDWLSPGDLLGGLRVGATGTIDEIGAVGPVGSVYPKAAAAAAAGADVVFVPIDADLARDAVREVGGDTTVVEIRDLAGAVAWLCDHGATTAEVCDRTSRQGLGDGAERALVDRAERYLTDPERR